MDAGTRTAAALMLVTPVGMLMLLLLLVVGAGSNRASCASGVGSAHAAGVEGAPGSSVAGLSESQLLLARNGVAIGIQRGMPESVIVSELAAQATETSLRNLANSTVPESLRYANDGVGSNHDSVGPHQLRYSIWGSVGIATLMDPIYQINWFYDQAEKIPGSESIPPAELAQLIEVSEPNAYAEQLDLARTLYAEFADIDPNSLSVGANGAAGCGGSNSNVPLTAAEASEFGRAVIAHAQRWIGTDYVWGGGDAEGPTNGGFDCSGLTLYAVYQASGGGIRLPHYTQAQQDDSRAQVVAFADRAPGDLIFFTAPGDADSHHVGVFYGRDEQGRDLLLHAPQTGQTVTITPLSAWDGEQMNVRRFGATGNSDSAGGGRT
ncbi:C40 family peptidase [Nocardia sp. NPDC058666]|uniref:C40 family peptidase n=1 Tax=unclassified Nocardia TaxID=2637762 RepID=UPI00364A023C